MLLKIMVFWNYNEKENDCETFFYKLCVIFLNK